MRLIVYIVMLFLVTPAYAQSWGDNKIRVIGEDGSVQEIEIPVAKEPPPEPSPVKEAPPAVTEEPSFAPMKDAPIVEEEQPVKAAPVEEKPAPAVQKAPPAPRNPYPNLPLPPRKPLIETQAPPEVASEAEDVEQKEPAKPQPVTLIGKERAKAIALEIAPPARSMVVQNRVVNGRPVYAVIFRTDSGPYEILVDGISGTILSTP